MPNQYMFLPLLPVAIATALGLVVALTGPDVPDRIFGTQTAHAGSAAMNGAEPGSAAEKQPEANVDADATVDTAKTARTCRSSASSHASARASDGNQTISREESAHDEGNGCSAHSSAKAKVQAGTTKTGGRSRNE